MTIKECLTEVEAIKSWLGDLKFSEDKEEAQQILYNIQDACEIMIDNLNE